MPQYLPERIAEVERKIAEAALNVNRKPTDIKLVAVTKTISLEIIRQAVDLGLKELGENRVQELSEKHQALPAVNWHLIGHLQKNKVRHVVGKVKLVHSLDSYGLAVELNKRSEAMGLVTDALVQVNVAQEKTKHGVDPAEVMDFVHTVSAFEHLNVKGLMTVAPFVSDPEEVRPVFRELHRQFDYLKTMDIPHVDMQYLSMGMSNDYKVAIEEGSNLVRIGSKIFGKRI